MFSFSPAEFRNIYKWRLCQVFGLDLGLEGPVLGLDSCLIALTASAHIMDQRTKSIHDTL